MLQLKTYTAHSTQHPADLFGLSCVLCLSCNFVQSLITSRHLVDSKTDVFIPRGITWAKRELHGFVRRKVERLELGLLAAGWLCRSFAVVVHVQAPGSLGYPVEGDFEVDNVLRFRRRSKY